MRALTFVLVTSIAAAAAGCVSAAQPAEQHAMRNGYSYLGERWVRGNGRVVHEAIGGLRHDGRWSSVMFNNFPGDGRAKVELWARP